MLSTSLRPAILYPVSPEIGRLKARKILSLLDARLIKAWIAADRFAHQCCLRDDFRWSVLALVGSADGYRGEEDSVESGVAKTARLKNQVLNLRTKEKKNG